MESVENNDISDDNISNCPYFTSCFNKIFTGFELSLEVSSKIPYMLAFMKNEAYMYCSMQNNILLWQFMLLKDDFENNVQK